jgi:hypothetical protein
MLEIFQRLGIGLLVGIVPAIATFFYALNALRNRTTDLVDRAESTVSSTQRTKAGIFEHRKPVTEEEVSFELLKQTAAVHAVLHRGKRSKAARRRVQHSQGQRVQNYEPKERASS